MVVGDTFNAVAYNDKMQVLTSQVIWSTGNPAVIDVDNNGVVTAKAVGTTSLNAQFGDLSSALNVEVTPVGTQVSGIISANTVWTTANSPYRIKGSVQIAGNKTLTIEPGVSVIGGEIVVGGMLQAIGTLAAPIKIKNISVSPAGSGGSPHFIIFEQVVMSGGRFYDNQSGATGALRVLDSRFSDLDRYIYIPNSSSGEVLIERNIFLRSGGISAGPVNVTIRNNYFSEWSGGFAIESWSVGNIIVKFNTFASTDRVALRLPNGGRMAAKDNWWLTSDFAALDSRIIDSNDNIMFGTFNDFLLGGGGFTMLTGPDPATPTP